MKRWIKTFKAVLAAAICLMLATGPVLAAEDNGVTLSLPVSQIFNVSGTAQKPDGRFTYTLKAVDAGAPMPEGSADGSYSFVMEGTQDMTLPPIQYTHAGVWRYQVAPTTQKEDPCYTLDTTVYTVDVYVRNTPDGGLSAEAVASFADDGTKTDGLLFTQVYNADKNAMTIGLRDLTIYTGGNELNGHTEGFPRPRYTGIPENAQWRVDGVDWQPAEPSVWSKAVAFIKGREAERPQYPFTVTYTRGREDSALNVIDTGRAIAEDTYPGLYVAHITPVKENAEISCSTDNGKTWRKVTADEAVLTVRNVLDRDEDHQLGVIVSGASAASEGLTDRQKDDLAAGVGVAVIPDGATLTVNNDKTLGQKQISETGLLFDHLLEPYVDNDTVDRFELLKDKAADFMEAEGIDPSNRQYEARYLDLVAYDDGNLWMASSEPTTIYWPYPEGTDQQTDFELQHFSDLFREYGIKGHDRVVEEIGKSTVNDVTIENTEYGIKFTAVTDGYGPFMLSWEPDETTPAPSPSADNAGDNLADTVGTGIRAHAGGAVAAGILIVGAVVLIVVVARRRKKDKE